jgi:uncharacterized membrane protein (DUF485 family)
MEEWLRPVLCGPRVRERSLMDSNRHEEWVRIERTPAFQEFARKRKVFLISATVFFLLFFFVFVVLAGFTTVLNGKAAGPLTWAYIYGLAQFPMTWILTHIYVNQANKWDDFVERAKREAGEEEAR